MNRLSIQSILFLATLAFGTLPFANPINKECDGERKSLAVDWTGEALRKHHGISANSDELKFLHVTRDFKANWVVIADPSTENGLVPVYRTVFSVKTSNESLIATCKVVFEAREKSSSCADATRLFCTKAYLEYSKQPPYLDIAL